jgi:hypothetical protein
MRRDDDEALDTPPEPAAVDLAWWAREMFDADLVAIELEEPIGPEQLEPPIGAERLEDLVGDEIDRIARRNELELDRLLAKLRGGDRGRAGGQPPA